MSDRYPDSTLDAKFAALEEKLDDHFEATTSVLREVVQQTTKTNGSVRSLQLWRQFILGGMTVLSLVVLPALGFLSYQILSDTNHISAIEAVINQLSAK